MSKPFLKSIVCGRQLDDCLRMVEDFHGFKAPGVVIGIFMVDMARELIESQVEADAVVETRHCLPDAVQLFTPCTAGNGWMKILDWNKFALTLYDRRELNGFHVWLDLQKAKAYPNLYKWLLERLSFDHNCAMHPHRLMPGNGAVKIVGSFFDRNEIEIKRPTRIYFQG
jgi:formylmethanofuran dehydrogenase subunit E